METTPTQSRANVGFSFCQRVGGTNGRERTEPSESDENVAMYEKRFPARCTSAVEENESKLEVFNYRLGGDSKPVENTDRSKVTRPPK